MRYIVEVPSGEIIWVPYSIFNILAAYNMLGYDKRGFHFFVNSKRKEVNEIIKYESKMVS